LTEPKYLLIVVVPVYNEQDTIVSVLTEWRHEISQHTENYRFLVVNDGSTDKTLNKLNGLNWSELDVFTHKNCGHGQSCLVGYRRAAELGAAYVFQIDSDGQCDPVCFGQVWSLRGTVTSIYGRRTTRDDGMSRWLVTLVLRYVLKALLQTKLNDTNVPYRLYPAKVAAEAANRIAPSFELANIAMALVMEPQGFTEVPIHFRNRMGGHASVRWYGFAQKAVRLIRDLKTLKHAK
jgi:dolichol-phosphate mannosyltransferase